MKPIEMPESNAVFKMEGCGDLPAVKAHDPETGQSYIISAWEVTPEDLKLLGKTGIVYLCTMGTLLPPVALSVENPIEPAEPIEERGGKT